MKILFLSHYFPPEVGALASRTYDHCREWVRQGHQVTVLTATPNYPRGEIYPGYRSRLWQREEKSGIQIVRVWTYVTPNERFLKRTISYVSYMISAILATPLLPKQDVVITTSPHLFSGLAGFVVSGLKRAPWVLEIRDLWPKSILAVGAIRNRTIIRALEWLERFAYRHADRIVPVTDAFQDYIEGLEIPADRIRVIKNGVDLHKFQPAAPNPALRAELGLDGKFVAAYVGTHGMAHHLETVLEAAALLHARTDISFLLVGDGAERARLQALKEQMGLRNVLMLPHQPRERMPAIWAATDLSLVVLRKNDLFKTVIPSKIFESMAMQRPVILGVEGESLEIVEEAGAGVGIEPENAAALAEEIALLASDPARCASMGRSGRAYVEAHFDRRVLANQYLQVLQDVVGSTKKQYR